MKILSVDLRQRILNSYDECLGTRQEIADQLSRLPRHGEEAAVQRKRTGDITPRTAWPVANRSLPWPSLPVDRLIERQPDITLEELVFVDEAGAKTNTTRLRGRSPQDQRVQTTRLYAIGAARPCLLDPPRWFHRRHDR